MRWRGDAATVVVTSVARDASDGTMLIPEKFIECPSVKYIL